MREDLRSRSTGNLWDLNSFSTETILPINLQTPYGPLPQSVSSDLTGHLGASLVQQAVGSTLFSCWFTLTLGGVRLSKQGKFPALVAVYAVIPNGEIISSYLSLSLLIRITGALHIGGQTPCVPEPALTRAKMISSFGPTRRRGVWNYSCCLLFPVLLMLPDA